MPRMPRQIETARLTLRPFVDADIEAIVAYRSEPGLWDYLRADRPDPYDRAEARTFLDRVHAGPWTGQPWYAVCMENRVIGDIDLTIDAANRNAEIGYTLSPTHWGQGLATEGAAAVVGRAFSTLDLVAVWAETDERNVASWRVMEKLGMRREGVLRHRHSKDGVPTNWVVYGVLSEEWAASNEEIE